MIDSDFHLNRGVLDRLPLPSANADSPIEFHRLLPGYRPSRLLAVHDLARKLGVAEVWVKEESNRFGLPAYKALGASWAIRNALRSESGASGDDLAKLRQHAGAGLTLVAATDGNHGWAVARVADWLGLAAHIYVPERMSPARVEAIRGEGARVTVVAGSYDDAVHAAAASANEARLLIQDTAWPGYEQVPAWIVEGYRTIFDEAEEQLVQAGGGRPDVVLVQIGVGSLAAAATRYFHRLECRPTLIGVEPLGAHCLLESARAGRGVSIADVRASAMAGLNCGTPSAQALPVLLQGMDAFVAIRDERAFEAMRLLAEEGIVAGASGAAGLAGLLEVLSEPQRVRQLNLDGSSRVLVILTEGDTDPAGYERVVGRPSELVKGW